MEIFQILCNDILPLLFFMGMGWLLDSRFKLDLNTYRKIVIWIVLPSFIFYSMAEYRPEPTAVFLIPAAVLLLLLLHLFSGLTARLLRLSPARRAVYQAAASYSNAGNIGLALIVFIYSHAPYDAAGGLPYLADARGTVILLLILMNIAVNLFGACQIRAGSVSVGQFLSYLVRMPALYAVIAGLGVQYTALPLQQTFLWPVLHHFAGAFIVLVTVIAGAELHRNRMQRPQAAVLAAAFHKLLLSPLLAAGIIAAAGCFTPTEAQVFFIAAAIPSSFTVVLYAAEYRNHADFAAQAVFLSTVFGIFTMTAAIYAARLLYPLQ